MMEQKIKEVQKYFVNKILALDFEVVTWGEQICRIKIDEKYNFQIWMGNDACFRNPVNIHGNHFMDLPFSEEQSIKLDKLLQPLFQKWKKEIALKDVEDKYNRLKNELENN